MHLRWLWGRRARRVYLALLLALVLLSTGLRVRSYLLTRKIYAVLSGLEQVRIDKTTEQQLMRTVPYLFLMTRRWRPCQGGNATIERNSQTTTISPGWDGFPRFCIPFFRRTWTYQ